jgi:hypothetical protein
MLRQLLKPDSTVDKTLRPSGSYSDFSLGWQATVDEVEGGAFATAGKMHPLTHAKPHEDDNAKKADQSLRPSADGTVPHSLAKSSLAPSVGARAGLEGGQNHWSEPWQSKSHKGSWTDNVTEGRSGSVFDEILRSQNASRPTTRTAPAPPAPAAVPEPPRRGHSLDIAIGAQGTH